MIETLKSVFKPEQIKSDKDSIQYYGKDWTSYFDVKAEAIVFPETVDQVVALVRWARQTKTALVPSGGRTGLSGAAVATKGEVVVSFERMNKILDFNELNQTVTIQPGVITENLQKFAVEKGFFYPVDFAARGSSHMGGNIATNAGGIKVLKYGLTRDWVASLKVVTGTGEVLELNRALIKNATGFDLRQLFIGSEGLLGFIVEATIRLTTPPPPTRLLLLGVSGLDAVMNVYRELKKKISITAFEIFSEKGLVRVMNHTGLTRPLETVAPYYLLAEFECKSAEEEEQALAAFEACVEKEWVLDGLLNQSDAQAATFWRFREDITESLVSFTPYKNDISVKISDVPNFMNDLDAVFNKAYPGWEIVWFGHIGDGNLHISILRPDNMTKEAFIKECRKVDELVFAAVKKYNGSISAEHGVGLTKKDFLEFTRSKEEIQIMRQIKKIFDPDSILNPGKVFDLERKTP